MDCGAVGAEAPQEPSHRNEHQCLCRFNFVPRSSHCFRLSGHLPLGVVRMYSRKVNNLFHDCSEALVKIKQAFHTGALDLPPEAATSPFHSITPPETFDLDEFEPLPDREMHLLHSNGAVDHHVTTREQIILQDPLEDRSYLESQFGVDERFPEGDVPRMGIDFDEDLLDKPSREASPDAVTLQDEVLRVNMGDGMNYDEMDRMEPMDVDDDHHETGTHALGMDMDLDYQPEAEGIENGDLNRSIGMIEDLERDRHSEEIEQDNFDLQLNKPDQLERAMPGTLETEEYEGKGLFVEEADKEETVEKPGIDDHVQEVVEDERAGLEGEGETSLERVWRGKRKERNNNKSLVSDFTIEIDSRLLSALLTGVNRAFPYISVEDLDTVTQEILFFSDW